MSAGDAVTPAYSDAPLPPQRMCCTDPETGPHTHDEAEPVDATEYAPEWAVDLARSITLDAAPSWAIAIAANQLAMARRQQDMQDTLTAMLDKIDAIGEMVKPTIDAISKHPMAKMFGVGK